MTRAGSLQDRERGITRDAVTCGAETPRQRHEFRAASTARPKRIAMADVFGREHFTEAMNALAGPAKRFLLYNVQFIPDLILYHLALDVLEQGRAVSQLVAAGVGRPAWVNSRAAFEATRDMLVLVAKPGEYCVMGARARVHEVLNTARLLERQRSTDIVLGIENQLETHDPDRDIEDEAQLWDQHSPGRGQLLRNALPLIRDQRLGAHWSGLTSSGIRDRVAAAAEKPDGIPEMMDALYGIQSIHAHPGSRTGLRDVSVKPDGTLFVEPREVDLKAPLGFTAMAAQLALIALQRRPTPT